MSFTSKGHDAGQAAALHALGLPSERLPRTPAARRFDGHPDIAVPGVEANSGSLGMGISKGRGDGGQSATSAGAAASW